MSKVNKPPFPHVRDFVKFISARERHRIGKMGERAVDKPDPIISQFRFCNVRRNDDRVTKWIHEQYLERWKYDENLWFALVVARLFNSEEPLGDIFEFVLPFRADPMRKRLKMRAALGKKNFNAAYIVSTAGARMDKVDYVIDKILVPAWQNRKRIAPFIYDHDTLDEVHEYLMTLNGLASFMAAQVIADLKYANPNKWSDFQTFAASGPGSKRGMNRIYGLPIDTPMSEPLFRARLAVLSESVHRLLPKWEPITAQDLQNCLCEADKWFRVRNNEGTRPKQLYRPKDE